ncbi:MAG: hypothetical protein ABRQ27_12345 [Clostridiaceae bacterium]
MKKLGSLTRFFSCFVMSLLIIVSASIPAYAGGKLPPITDFHVTGNSSYMNGNCTAPSGLEKDPQKVYVYGWYVYWSTSEKGKYDLFTYNDGKFSLTAGQGMGFGASGYYPSGTYYFKLNLIQYEKILNERTQQYVYKKTGTSYSNISSVTVP